MTLIVILFCLALQRFVNAGGWFKISWFEAYLRFLTPRISKLPSIIIISIVVIPVLLLFALIQIGLGWYKFGLFDLILSALVLLFCIDARDLKSKLKPYFEALKKSDMHKATTEVNDFISDSSIGNIADLRREVTRAILLNSFEKMFVGLFWFVIFNIYGVLTYFMIAMLSECALRISADHEKLAKLAEKIQSIIEWMPARVLGFTYALVGNFNKGFSFCIKNLWSGLDDVKRIAIDSGFAALDISEDNEVVEGENESALKIVNRVLFVWLIGVALIFVGVLF